jgi:protein SCO1/2
VSARRTPYGGTLRAVLAIVAACVVAPAAALDYDAAMNASQAAVGRSLDDYAFTDGDGRRVRLADFRGKPLVVSFIYTGCGQVCPTTTKFVDRAVRQADRELGDGAFRVASIGFNLPFDNPAAMRNFAREQGIDRRDWRFLSPDPGSVDALTRDFGFTYAANAGGFDHVAQLTLVDANGRIARQFYGETFDPSLLTSSLRAVAAGERPPLASVTDVLDRVRILCSVYDPSTGKYRLDYALFIEIFAGLTVLGAIAHYLLREWRRQRRTLARRPA